MTCCREFSQAQEVCTDNEGYGKLILARDEEWHIGCGLMPIKFCPWCGAQLQQPKEPTP